MNPKGQRYLRICPKCKSANIRMDKSTMQQLGALPTMYICNACGHSGYSFPEVTADRLEKFSKEIKSAPEKKNGKSELVDTAYGKFEVRFIWKFSAPFLIVAAAILFLSGESPLIALGLLLLGLITGYITFFKKRKLRE